MARWARPCGSPAWPWKKLEQRLSRWSTRRPLHQVARARSGRSFRASCPARSFPSCQYRPPTGSLSLRSPWGRWPWRVCRTRCGSLPLGTTMCGALPCTGEPADSSGSASDAYSFVLEGQLGRCLVDAVMQADPGDLVFKPGHRWHTPGTPGDTLLPNPGGDLARRVRALLGRAGRRSYHTWTNKQARIARFWRFAGLPSPLPRSRQYDGYLRCSVAKVARHNVLSCCPSHGFQPWTFRVRERHHGRALASR